MSLQIWLPLDKDLKNYGIANVTMTNSNATLTDGGRFGGKYLSAGTLTIPAASSATIFNRDHMSFAFWLYPVGTSSNGTMMGQSSMNVGDNRMYTIFQYSTPNGLHLSWQDETSSSAFLSGLWGDFFPADTWTHCCVTYNGSKAIIYRNGTQYATANGASNRAVFNYNYPISGSSIRKLNDIRIYDEVLSPELVKSLARVPQPKELQLWMPMTKDLRNQGLKHCTPVGNNVTLDTTGKLGGSYYFSGTSSYIDTGFKEDFGTGDFTITAWVKLTSSSKTYQPIISNKGTGAASVGCAIYFNHNQQKFLWSTADGSSGSEIWTSDTFSNIYDKWTHVIMVRETGASRYGYFYINGERKELTGNPSIKNVTNNTYNMMIGDLGNHGGASYLWTGNIADVRMYNYAISAEEAKELSQGLVLHYPLSDSYIQQRLWSSSGVSSTKSLTTSNTYVYSIPTNTVFLTSGKQYTTAAEVRVNQDGISFGFDSNCTDKDGVYPGNDQAQTVNYATSYTGNLPKNEWVPVWLTTTVKSDAGNPYYHHGFLFKTVSGTIDTLCEVRNVEVYEGAERFRRGILPVDGIVHDISGFDNDGEAIGSILCVSDTPRYLYCCKLNTSNPTVRHYYDDSSYIRGDISLATPNELTITFWSNVHGSYDTGVHGVVATSNNSALVPTDYNTTAIHNRDGGLESKASDGTYINGIGSVFLKDAWHHYALVYNGQTWSTYRDGALYSSKGFDSAKTLVTISQIYFGYSQAGGLGRANDGYYSDIRVYVTALSANDILALYQLGHV